MCSCPCCFKVRYPNATRLPTALWCFILFDLLGVCELKEYHHNIGFVSKMLTVKVGMPCLSHMRKLTVFGVFDFTMFRKLLRRVPRLRQLKISKCIAHTTKVLTAIVSNVSLLEELVLEDVVYASGDLYLISGLKNLRSLRLDQLYYSSSKSDHDDVSRALIFTCPSLQHLELHKVYIRNKDLTFLNNMPKLTSVVLGDHTIYYKDYWFVKTLHSVRSVTVVGKLVHGGHVGR